MAVKLKDALTVAAGVVLAVFVDVWARTRPAEKTPRINTAGISRFRVSSPSH
jgi:hypothetical protein